MILSPPPLFFSRVILITSIICQILLGLLAVFLFSMMIMSLIYDHIGDSQMLAYWTTGILSIGLIVLIQKYKKLGITVSAIYVITGILLSYNEMFRELVELPPLIN